MSIWVLPTYIGIQNALIIPFHSNGGHGEDRGNDAEVCHETTETAEENSKDPIPLKKIITMIPSGGKHRWKKVASQKHISHVFFRKFPGTMEVRKNGVRLRKNGAKLQNIGKFWKEQTTPKALFLFPFLNKRVSFIKRTRLFKILLFIIL